MSIASDFENMTAELNTSIASAVEDVNRLKKEVHEDLDIFNKNFAI